MPNLALAFGALLGGAVIADYGVKNLRTGFATASATAPTSGSVTIPDVPAGGKVYGQISYDQVAAIGKAKGWNTAQINDWFYHLIPSESNGTLNATNPKSHAYGVAQGITGPSWYRDHGGDAGTVTGQLTAMANYIDQRYGDPSAAWSFHQQHNWY